MSNEPIQQRPGLVTAVAVINFIFGGLGILGAVCGGIGILFLGAMANAQPQGGGPNPIKELIEVFENIPGYIPFVIVSMVLGLIAAVMLIVSGFGLLKMRNWARIFCICYGVYLLLNTAVGLVYTYTVVNPAMEKWAADFQKRAQQGQMGKPGQPGMPPPQNPANNMGGMIGGVFGSLINVVYGIGLIVVMMLPDVRRAFREGGVRAIDREPDDWGRGRRDRDRYDDDDRRPRYRPGDDRIEPADDR